VAEKKPGLNLVQKGLLLILVPLVVQLVLLADISMLVRQSDEDLKRTANSLSVSPLTRTSIAVPTADLSAAIAHRKETNSLIIGAGACVAVASFLMLAFFMLGIARRLTVLNDSIQRFASGRVVEPRSDGSGELAGVEKAFYEMTTALREAERKNREAEQLKQEFVAMVTHDLRTPLTSIKLFQQMLADGTFGPVPKSAEVPLASSQRSIERLLKLANGLLDFEKLAAGQVQLKLAPTRLSTIIDRSIESISQYAEQRQVTIARQVQDAELVCDEERLIQVVVNLLSNAIKFSDRGSSVTVEAGSDGETDQVQINVVDRGRGIPEMQCNEIFERYKQVDPADGRNKRGIGLGLPIAKSLVEQHGGSIGVRSELGQGSCFWMRIPCRTASIEHGVIVQRSTVT
jgi:signal transduction histidine kinase